MKMNDVQLFCTDNVRRPSGRFSSIANKSLSAHHKKRNASVIISIYGEIEFLHQIRTMTNDAFSRFNPT